MIELKNGYWIKAETIGFSLNQNVKPKKGFRGQKPDPDKVTTKTIGFYGTLEGCLSRYLDACVHDEVEQTEIQNIMYLRGLILAAKNEIKNHLNQTKK